MDKAIKSRLLKEFISEITFRNRNPQDTRALQLLNDISTNSEQIINPNEKLYRSRIIKQSHQTGQSPNFYGLDAKDSYIAPVKATRDMRANYRCIPYLYCTNNPYVSIVEVRPRLGASVSVATIVAKEKIVLLDFTNRFTPTKMSDAKKNLFSDLSFLYSRPIAEEDDVIDYIPTQFVAEYAKNLGYDGIIYKSSLVPELEKEGAMHNVVVFNYKKCEPIRSNVFQITSNQIDARQIDNDSERMTIQSHNTEILEILFGNN